MIKVASQINDKMDKLEEVGNVEFISRKFQMGEFPSWLSG